MKNLFQSGEFRLNSGLTSTFKIECDNLTPDDWETLAFMGSLIVPRFSNVMGIPRGGIPFAEAMFPYASADNLAPLLVLDDVWTTGNSMRKAMREGDIGLVAFARTKIDVPNIYAIWTLGEMRRS